MTNPILQIKEICLQHQLSSLGGMIESIEELSKERRVDVVVLGQFNSGKSSFLNSLIGQPLLPQAVIPATSVITKIQYGSVEKATIHFLDGNKAEITVNQLDEYITEAKNPNNVKQVLDAIIETPTLQVFKQIRFIDTPGLGSFFINNTQTTESWIDRTTIAIICISAERPLSEADLKIIENVRKYSYQLVFLLTKTDLLQPRDIDEIEQFIRNSLKKLDIVQPQIFKYSVYSKTEEVKQNIVNIVFQPLLREYDQQVEKIIEHKIITLIHHCLNYLEIALHASQKSEQERKLLRQKILDEKTHSKYIRQELELITENDKATIRDNVFTILNTFQASLTQEILKSYENSFPSWKGNLYRLARQYEEWVKSELTLWLKEILDNEHKKFNDILQEINKHYAFYTANFREKLSHNIFRVLGIHLTPNEWKPQFRPIQHPDISVYPAFDSPIDLLWFLFPMFIFRNSFRKYFRKQISKEVEKNIHRITSDITELIINEAAINKENTISYINQELQTIETVLSGESVTSLQIENSIKTLQSFL